MRTVNLFVRALPACVLALLLAATPAWAQAGATLSGTVTRAGSGEAMGGTTVVVEELKREARTAADGTFRFENLAPGEYHVVVRADGFTSRRTEVDVTAAGATVDLEVDLDVHFAEIVSVSPNPRAQFESYQATSVLAGQDLQKQLEPTVGETLRYESGIAMRGLGPGPSRPVIRGLDGDRVLVLQDGQRIGDLSSQSGDHGVTSNPAAASRIEVVRGPASLLYGANAIGGLVNVVTEQIPMAPVTGVKGRFTTDLASNAGQAGGAGDVTVGNGRFALNLGGGGRRSGDYDTPEGEVDNSQTRNGFFNVGGGWTGDRQYAGASYSYNDNKYGVPVLEEGEISLTPRTHAFSFRTGGQGLDGTISGYRATLGVRRYQHSELEGEEVGTTFKNNQVEFEGLASHKPFGKLSGTVGTWLLNRNFEAIGEEALSPPVDQQTYSAFLYEELTWPHFTLQFGGRVDDTTFEPDGGLPVRDFTTFSGSVGALIRPQAANDNVVIALNLARAARNPALEELYFFGPHPGNLAYEIGNPDLEAERGLGFEGSLRTRFGRVHTELTFFRNDIKDFIFRNPLTEEEFEAREDEFDDRFGVEHGEGEEEGGHHEGEFPYVEFLGADSVLWGVEAKAEVEIATGLFGEFQYDFVRGELSDTNDPLPRIPPYRVMGGLRYQKNAFQVGGNVIGVAEQTRVYGEELPTDGYGLLRLFASYSLQTGQATHTFTARLDNATNEAYRNHLNFLKDQILEIGRNFRLVYAVSF
jgi:iron complex outermembrane receptor protein